MNIWPMVAIVVGLCEVAIAVAFAYALLKHPARREHFKEQLRLMPKQYVFVSGAAFGTVAIGQAVRALLELQVQIGTFMVPVWASWLAAVVAGSLCAWAFRSRVSSNAAQPGAPVDAAASPPRA